MDYLNSTGPSSTSSIYGTLPRTKKREKSKREKRTPEDMAAHIANYVVYKAEPVSTHSKLSQVQTQLNNSWSMMSLNLQGFWILKLTEFTRILHLKS